MLRYIMITIKEILFVVNNFYYEFNLHISSQIQILDIYFEDQGI